MRAFAVEKRNGTELQEGWIPLSSMIDPKTFYPLIDLIQSKTLYVFDTTWHGHGPCHLRQADFTVV